MYIFSSNSKGNLALRLYQPSSSYAHMCFSVGEYVLWFLVSALSGVVAYQLYVDPTQMLCMFLLSFHVSLTLKEYPRLVLPFFKPVHTTGSFFTKFFFLFWLISLRIWVRVFRCQNCIQPTCSVSHLQLNLPRFGH